MGNEEVFNVIKEVDNIVTDDFLVRAEKRVHMIKKMIGMSLQATNYQDWVDQNGKPYLMGTGAEKVGRLWGVKLHNIKTEKINSEDEKGRFYIYKTTGQAELPSEFDSIEALGTCSSKDQFFALVTIEKINEEGKTVKEKVLKPFSEIDETNIMKSSYTNFLVNAITRLIGLRGLTYDQLKDAGIDVSKISQVRYQGSEMSEESKGLKDQCWESILILCDKDIPKAKAKLKELTGFKGKDSKMVPGKDNIEWLTELQIKILHGKLKDLMPKKAEEAKKEEKGAVGGSQEEKRGKSDESHVKFIDSMHGLLKKVGKEAYFKVLGDHGFTSETGIFDRKDQIKVYEALSKLAEVKNA